jgi:cation transporter-like permease
MSRRAGSLLFIILSVGIASSISLIGGIGIEVVQEKLLSIVPLLIALPGLNSMVGDYATLIAAHAGDPEERTRSHGDLIKAMLPSIGINILFVFTMSTVLAAQRGYALTPLFMGTFAAFVVFSILAVIAIMLVITLALDALLRNRPLNPDDVLIPIVTTISDIFMLGLIALAAWFLF